MHYQKVINPHPRTGYDGTLTFEASSDGLTVTRADFVVSFMIGWDSDRVIDYCNKHGFSLQSCGSPLAHAMRGLKTKSGVGLRR